MTGAANENGRRYPRIVRQRQTDVSEPGSVRLGCRQCRLRQDPRAGAAGDQLAAQWRRAGKDLCITFTKAAAANMARRVFDTLGKWTKLGDDALDKAIEGSGIPPARSCARGRGACSHARWKRRVA